MGTLDATPFVPEPEPAKAETKPPPPPPPAKSEKRWGKKKEG